MPAEMVDVFFEDGTKLGSEVLQLYRASGAIEKLRNKFKVSQIISLQKGSSIGILPADLVAYEFFEYHYNKRAYPELPLRKSMLALQEHNKQSLGIFFSDPRGIRQYLDILRESGIIEMKEARDETANGTSLGIPEV